MGKQLNDPNFELVTAIEEGDIFLFQRGEEYKRIAGENIGGGGSGYAPEISTLTLGADQTINNSETTKLNFSNASPSGIWDTVNKRFTASGSQKIRVSGQIWYSPNSGDGYYTFGLWKGGMAGTRLIQSINFSLSGRYISVPITPRVITLSNAEYIEFSAWHNSGGGSAAVFADPQYSWAEIEVLP